MIRGIIQLLRPYIISIERHDFLSFFHTEVVVSVLCLLVINTRVKECNGMLLMKENVFSNLSVVFQVEPKEFARRLLDWSENGFPELNDKCGYGLDASTKAVLMHPQFSETPQKVGKRLKSNMVGIIFVPTHSIAIFCACISHILSHTCMCACMSVHAYGCALAFA